MTVGDLIEKLQEYEQDREVRIAYQPNHPLWSSIDDAVTVGECLTRQEREDSDEELNVVFIVSGHQSGYATSKLWR